MTGRIVSVKLLVITVGLMNNPYKVGDWVCFNLAYPEKITHYGAGPHEVTSVCGDFVRILGKPSGWLYGLFTRASPRPKLKYTVTRIKL